jgi:hypothetical protein
MAEFAVNNHISERTGISPFFIKCALNPGINFELDIKVDNSKDDQAHTLADCLAKVYNLIKREMSFAQD